MSYVWSPACKFSTWRKLWLALATGEKELGISITDAQISEMEAKIFDIDFGKAAEYEAKFRHDVMGHVHAFGDVAPAAMPILHLGATSCYIGDNADCVQLKKGLELVRRKIAKCVDILRKVRGGPSLRSSSHAACSCGVCRVVASLLSSCDL